MAKMGSKGKNSKKFNYAQEIKALKENGPEQLYLLYGAEDYLREQFFEELRRLCVGSGDAEFNHHRIMDVCSGVDELREAVESMPFFAEHTLVEARGFDPAKMREKELEALKTQLNDIPDYCTLVLIPPTGKDPDGRLAITKAIKKTGHAIEFAEQEQSVLTNWIGRRFAVLDKEISKAAAEHLIFVSGSLMNRLIMEIEKIAGYTKGGEVTKSDIDAVASRLTETNIFEMTEKLSKRDYDGAASIAGKLILEREHPIMLTAMVGQQFRRLYAAKVAIDEDLGKEFITSVCGVKFDFIVNRLMGAARDFSIEQLARDVQLCTETDFALKSSGGDGSALFVDLLLKLAAGV